MSMGSGLLVVDKPQGVTSHDVVAAVRRVLHTKHVGHAGTLDPMATGVLVVGFGSATRLLNYIVGSDKTYETTIRLGRSTTTDDADGEFLPLSVGEYTTTADVVRLISDDDIRAAASRQTGDIMQVPSSYSAKKIHGQKAYDMARNGEDVKLAPHEVTISEFTILGIARHEVDAAYGPMPVIDVDARITCSTGTYIRAIGRDMGADLGVGGYLTRLRRVRVGSFDAGDPMVVTAHAEPHTFINRAGERITHQRAVLDIDDPEALQSKALTPAQGAQRAMPVMQVTPAQAEFLVHGRFIDGVVHEPTAAICHVSPSMSHAHDGMEDWLVAIVERGSRTQLKPSVVFIDH